jgi:hypothetical protein
MRMGLLGKSCAKTAPWGKAQEVSAKQAATRRDCMGVSPFLI